MINQIFIFVLFLCISCVGEVKSRFSSSDSDLFDKYLKLFQVNSLPIAIDRAVVIKLNNDKQILSPISNIIYKQYIPEEIRNKDSNNPSSYRALYLLPEINNNLIVLVVKDIFIESEMYSAVIIYMVSYKKDSEIIDFKEIAMFRPESSEAFACISETYEIEGLLYQRKMNTNKEYSKFAYMIETKSKCKIDESGNIKEIFTDKTEGFFELVSGGYKLIKEVN